MSEREDVDPVEEILTALESEDDYVRSWKLARQIRNELAVHDELIRADERKRLAGEFEKFAALLPIPQSRDAFLAAAGNLRATSERLAGEVGALARVEALRDEWREEARSRPGGPPLVPLTTAWTRLDAALHPEASVRLTEEE